VPKGSGTSARRITYSYAVHRHPEPQSQSCAGGEGRPHSVHVSAARAALPDGARHSQAKAREMWTCSVLRSLHFAHSLNACLIPASQALPRTAPQPQGCKTTRVAPTHGMCMGRK
jgi:hypothetical protein